MIRVFVYGSLLSHCYNHKYYLRNQKYLGAACLNGYSLYSLGSYPGVVADGQGTVLGEVYEINEKVLARLDRLEENGRRYTRRPVMVQVGEETIDAVVYVYNGTVQPDKKIGLEAQPWSDRRDKRSYEE